MTSITSKMTDIVAEQVKSYFANNLLEIVSVEKQEDVFFLNRMSLILVANSDFRLLVKVHCNDCDVKNLAKDALQFVEGNLDHGLGDFIKELTNLLGGSLKRSLESSQIQIGLSLPLMIHGFDELFSEKGSLVESSYISLGYLGQKIIVQIHVDFLTENAREILSRVDFSINNDTAGGFEFL